MPRPSVDHDAADLRRLYQEGKTLEQIGKHYGVSRGCMSLWFKQAGICCRPSGRYPRGNHVTRAMVRKEPKRLSKVMETRLRDLWGLGLTQQQISAKLEMSTDKLAKHLRGMGFTTQRGLYVRGRKSKRCHNPHWSVGGAKFQAEQPKVNGELSPCEIFCFSCESCDAEVRAWLPKDSAAPETCGLCGAPVQLVAAPVRAVTRVEVGQWVKHRALRDSDGGEADQTLQEEGELAGIITAEVKRRYDEDTEE